VGFLAIGPVSIEGGTKLWQPGTDLEHPARTQSVKIERKVRGALQVRELFAFSQHYR